ncbi:MAG: glutamate-1-semialdehyde 2,1-aminomutase [Bdellovibrionales bacterium]|nr:glutamate-1-semialdehyde 2,1-aminomutase [Bdellovibrionales bacterium]
MSLSQEYFQRALKVIPGGVHSPVRAFKSVGGQPLFFRSATGAYLESVEGKKYLDFCQSFGPHLLGHRDEEIAQAVHETVDLAWSFGACEPYSLELAEWIVEKIPWIENIRFVNSGTEAVMSALRLARAATGRSKILKFEGCYHGHVDALLVKSGSGLAGVSAADSAGLDPLQVQQTLVASLDDENSVEQIFNQHGSDIAVVIIEPLPANFGLLVQRETFLQKIFSIAKKNGSLILFDEVISGFRVGLGGMAERLNLIPDLVTYGKVIGGGFPVGAYAGKKSLMDFVAPVGPVYQAGTLSANPVGMVAGLTTLKKAHRLNLFTDLENRTNRFITQINQLCEAKNWPLQAISMGSLFWLHDKTSSTIRALKDIPSSQSKTFKAIFHGCLEQGIYLAPSGFEVGFISAAHTTDLLDQVVQKLESVGQKIFHGK